MARDGRDNVKRIFDPVHHFIELSDGEAALLDTPPLQRLRRLRQLGLAYLAFPAAEHSRFTHALGAMAVGERVIASLREQGAFRDEHEYAAQRRLLRASLLLHDVGHGPFSHASEAVLGRRHEERTYDILALPEIRAALERLGVDPADVGALVAGSADKGSGVLRELVSGPNLDADRMDYLLRDAYFTGVVSGRYDAEQLIGSLRIYETEGGLALGVDGRGTVALESFVLARYMMFATVYFHHTTRMFERILQQALRETWPNPRDLDDIDRFLEWDDFRVLDTMRSAHGIAARALRERRTLYAVVAEFNGERDLTVFEACRAALQARFGEALWADEQEQLYHRLPLDGSDGRTVLVGTRYGVVDAREASDVVARIAGKAYWRKLFVLREGVPVDEARRIARDVITR